MKTFCAALFISETVSFVYVYLSNINLGTDITALHNAGHIVVPNSLVIPSLFKFSSAFYGSLFFTFTAGIVVSSLISLIAGIIFIKQKSFLNKKSIKQLVIPLTALLITISLFNIHGDRGIYLRIRDYILLSSKPGIALNNFYYKHTLYAAQALKSPFQKQIKPCWIDPEISEKKRVQAILFKYGWLNLNQKSRSCLIMEKASNDTLKLKWKNNLILSLSVKDFIQKPDKFLKEFSQKTDNNKFLRALCLTGLVLALPLVLFILFFSSMLFLLNRLLPLTMANIISGIIVVSFSTALLFYLNPVQFPESKENIQKMLESKKPKTRIKALRAVCRKKYNITAMGLINNGNSAEKYWLANALANKHSRQNLIYLRRMTKDKSINVKCASIRAISKISCSKTDIMLFKKTITHSPDWYVQNTAYNALKRCL